MDDTRRRWLTDSIMSGSTLEHVAEAIASHAPSGERVYVERRGGEYRWSPAHAGGAYPLLRTLAMILDVDYHALILPFITVEERAIVNAPAPSDADAASFIEATTDAPENTRRIEAALEG